MFESFFKELFRGVTLFISFKTKKLSLSRVINQFTIIKILKSCATLM